MCSGISEERWFTRGVLGALGTLLGSWLGVGVFTGVFSGISVVCAVGLVTIGVK